MLLKVVHFLLIQPNFSNFNYKLQEKQDKEEAEDSITNCAAELLLLPCHTLLGADGCETDCDYHPQKAFGYFILLWKQNCEYH